MQKRKELFNTFKQYCNIVPHLIIVLFFLFEKQDIVRKNSINLSYSLFHFLHPLLEFSINILLNMDIVVTM